MPGTEKQENFKNALIRNGCIMICSALGSYILFSPARNFGAKSLVYIIHSNVSDARRFGVFCGIASVGATALLGFNAWDKILTKENLLRRLLFYIGGIITAGPLMIDNFQLNQQDMDLIANLILTILPGLFMSGVFGQAVEFVFNEIFQGDKKHINGAALGVGTTLGSIAAIGSYWEAFNLLSPLIKLSIPSYIVSTIPVVFRSALFIKSTYNVSQKVLGTLTDGKKPPHLFFLFLTIVLLFLLFTIGGYSDVVYNGMMQSHSYQDSAFFRYAVYPTILAIAMLCMWLLITDAIVTVGDRVNKYFIEHGYNRYLTFKRTNALDTEETPIIAREEGSSPSKLALNINSV